MIIILPATVPQVAGSTDFHTSSYNNIEESYDISLNWSQLLGSKDWTTFKLWDDDFSTHCYVSFKFNAGLDLLIPANLRINYPALVEPGQQFNLETELALSNNKEVTFSTEFFVKLDLDLPIPLWIPGFGLTDDIKNTFGGSWDFTFNLNTQTLNNVMKTVSLGNNDVVQSFANYLGVDDFVTIENININSHTLGRLAFGTIRINFLKAILAAAKALTSLTPPFEAMVEALDWLLTNVIKVDTGLKLTPSLNAEIISPISSNSQLTFSTNSLTYNQDISTKRTSSTVSQLAKESKSNNQIYVNLGPLDYSLSFTSDWAYYLDLDIDFLNVNIYENSWSCNLGIMPNLSTKVTAVTRQIGCDIKLDEPIHANTPQADNGEVSIEVNDNSGVSNVNLIYSTDKKSWKTTSMLPQGDTYKVTPISSVEQDTTVYYYFEAADGDNDVYKIDNNGVYYSYLMEPEKTGFFDWASELGGGNSNFIWILLIIIVAAVAVAVLLFFGIKRKPRLGKPRKNK